MPNCGETRRQTHGIGGGVGAGEDTLTTRRAKKDALSVRNSAVCGRETPLLNLEHASGRGEGYKLFQAYHSHDDSRRIIRMACGVHQ